MAKKETKTKLVIKEVEKPITIEEIEGTMKYLGPKLENAKTKDEATIELENFHRRMRSQQITPEWK